jgi:GT2 family glycosyltransferase
MQLSVVIPTLGNDALLRRVLDGYERQDASPSSFEVIVVADRADRDPHAVDAAIGQRRFPVRRLSGEVAGASGARNTGWRAARAPLVLFTDDDTIPVPALVSEHLAWHERAGGEGVAVVGHVRWARGLRVTPFMRWLERGVQFEFSSIRGTEASWAHLYSCNCSLKRALIERVGGYDEERFPYGHEDLELGYRARDAGLRVRYNRRAVVEHDREMTIALWQARAARLAGSERRLCELHPEIEPMLWRRFADASSRPPQRGRAARLAGAVPRWMPWVGPAVWDLADIYWRQQIAPQYLAAWDAAGGASADSPSPGVAALAERAAGAGAETEAARLAGPGDQTDQTDRPTSSSGSWPGGPK